MIGLCRTVPSTSRLPVTSLLLVLRAVSANLGWGLASNAAPLDHLGRWLKELRAKDADLLFLQEMPGAPEWQSMLVKHGYQLHEGAPARPRYCRSGVAVHESLGRGELVTLPTQDYHGSYVAAAAVELVGPGAVTCISVHASPTPLRPEDVERWTGPDPRRRAGGPTDPPVWDSDYVLATLIAATEAGPVLAAGDFNEARRWDADHAGHWGRDYFLFADDAGLRDLTYRAWKEERPTHRPRGDEGRYQTDHVFATDGLADRFLDASIGPHPGSDHESIVATFEADGPGN
jgi:endonuclease/exonuclease/phosphatase family metal-dependent hydrolase